MWKKLWFCRKALYFLELPIHRSTSIAIKWKHLWFFQSYREPMNLPWIFKHILEIIYTLYLTLDYTKYRSKSFSTHSNFLTNLYFDKLNHSFCGRISTIRVTKNRKQVEIYIWRFSKRKTDWNTIFQPITNFHSNKLNNRNTNLADFKPIKNRQGLNSIRS